MSASRVVLVGWLGGIAACAPSAKPAETGQVARSAKHEADGAGAGEVRVWGALRAVMHEGKTDGNVAIASVVPGPHAYAVGALSGLRGEITILDDDVVVSFGEPGGTVRTPAAPPPGEMATLLVRATVPAWSDHRVDRSIDTRHVSEEIEKIAKDAGLDVEQRIPVVIDATAKSLDWHVLAGQGPRGHEGHGAMGHGAHHGPRSIGKLAGAKVRLVGFFSRHDEAVFTHMGEHTHFHVVTSGERMTGHVDDMELEPGAMVRIPASR